MHIREIASPVVFVVEPVLQHNITRMADLCRRHGKLLRPHVKSHNLPPIAQRQLAAGACGITVATLQEARTMAAHGLRDAFLAREILDEPGLRELADLSRSATTCVAVDSAEGISRLSAVMSACGVCQPVLIEVDSGGGRCGLTAPAQVAELAALASRSAGVEYAGIFTHEGHVYGVGTRADVRPAAEAAIHRMAEMAESLGRAGLAPRVVSVGASPSAKSAGSFDGITEIRPGNYVFNDGMQLANGSATVEDCALRVMATVISRPAAERVVLNVGTKLLGSDRGGNVSDSGGYGRLIAPAAHTIARLYEEHAVIVEPNALRLGDSVAFVPSHACMTANLARDVVLVDGDGTVLERWRNCRFG